MPSFMDYVGIGFSWFLFLACIAGFVSTSGRAGDKLIGWLPLTFAFASFGIAYSLVLVNQYDPEPWYIPGLKLTGWILATIGVCLSIWQLNEERFF